MNAVISLLALLAAAQAASAPADRAAPGVSGVLGPAAQAPDRPARRAVPDPPLHLLFSDEDYPAEAQAGGEQGTVGFRLSVAADGRVSACEVTASSGSALLDSTACRILAERARFRPAGDGGGKAVPDVHTGSITWRIPEDEEGELPPATEAAMSLWLSCLWGKAADQALSATPAADVVDRAFAGCTRHQERALDQMARDVEGFDPPTHFPVFREQQAKELTDFLTHVRSLLGSEGRI